MTGADRSHIRLSSVILLYLNVYCSKCLGANATRSAGVTLWVLGLQVKNTVVGAWQPLKDCF